MTVYKYLGCVFSTLWSIFFLYLTFFFFLNSIKADIFYMHWNSSRNAGLAYDLYLIPVFVPVPVACVRMLVGLRCTTGSCLPRYKVIMQDLPLYVCPLLTQGP